MGELVIQPPAPEKDEAPEEKSDSAQEPIADEKVPGKKVKIVPKVREDSIITVPELSEKDTGPLWLKMIFVLAFGLLNAAIMYDLYAYTKETFEVAKLFHDLAFLIKLTPAGAALPLIYAVLSIWFIYLAVRLWNPSKKSWWLAVGFPVPIALVYGWIYLGANRLNSMLPKDQPVIILDWFRPVNIGFYLLYLVVFVLLIVFKRKFESPNIGLKKWAKVIVGAYALVTIVFMGLFYIPAAIRLYEKPFIGFTQAKKYLGKAPISFGYIPAGLSQIGADTTGSGSERKFVLIYNEANYTKNDKIIYIYESIDNNLRTDWMRIPKNDQDYYYSYTDNAESVMFRKNDLTVMIVMPGAGHQEELLKIAESAK